MEDKNHRRSQQVGDMIVLVSTQGVPEVRDVPVQGQRLTQTEIEPVIFQLPRDIVDGSGQGRGGPRGRAVGEAPNMPVELEAGRRQ
jgi:hypothetical protein